MYVISLYCIQNPCARMLKPSSSNSNSVSISSTSTSNSSSNSTLISSNETPQSFWLNSFLRKSTGSFSTGIFGSENEFKASLVKDLAVAMEVFSVDKFRTDYYFLLIWLSYIKLQL